MSSLSRCRLRCVGITVGLGLAAASLRAAPPHTDGHWVFENDTLRVSVNDATGNWDVLDKRCDRLWRQATQPEAEQLIVPVGKLGTSPTLDGRLDEWSGSGSILDSKSAACNGDRPAVQDCSARFHMAWDDAGWWLAADVTDDRLCGPADGTPLWHVDSVELWLGEEHWGFAPAEAGVQIACWSNPEMAEGCRATARQTVTGWQLEAFVPWSRVAALPKAPQAGSQVLLSFGLNDADGAAKRDCQLFYPLTYIHKDFATHVQAELAERGPGGPPRSQRHRRSKVLVRRMSALAAPAEGVEIELDYAQERGGGVPLTVRTWLLPGAGDVAYELSGDLSTVFHELALPAPFILEAAAGKLVIPQAAGLLFGVDELDWDGGHLGGKMSMPWFGAADLATGHGYIAVFETPDDARFRGAKVRGQERDVLSCQALFVPQKGTLGYTRRMLYHFADRDGYVALAKRYRAYAKRTGLLETLAEKRKKRPGIDRLVGAVNIYGSHFANIEALRHLGVERAMVSGFSGDHVRQMNEWGYLPGRYDIYTDLYEPGTHPSKMERCEGFTFPDDVIKKADGSNQVGWCPIADPKTGEKIPSYVICWSCGLRTLKQKMPKRLSNSPHTSYFLDCVTATRLYECHDPRHPLTRTTDRETRVKQFAYLSGELGLMVGSEAGRDWAAHVADYFEGIMSTASFFANPKAIHEMPFVSCESTPRYEEYGTNATRRVPLFQLVYGDCVETTWRWGDNSHRMPKLWAQKDLLQIIHAAMPTWVLWDPHQGLFWGNRGRFKECYDNVCRWRRAVGYSEMIDHERLSDDGLVQRSSFANGAAVTVNFATERRTADGNALPPRSFLITGNAPELAGLPVGSPVQVDDSWQPKHFVLSCNTGFEQYPNPWGGQGGMKLVVQDDIVRSGKQAAKLTGTQTNGWSFAASVRVPLEPGKLVTVRGWLRIDTLQPDTMAPCFKCGIYKDDTWLTNRFTPQYDLTKRGTWQELVGTFTVPEEATHGRIALEKRTSDPVGGTLYIDDVELIEAGLAGDRRGK